MTSLHTILLLIFLTVFIFPQGNDSVKTYDLEQITVEAGKELETKIITSIDNKEIGKADAPAIDKLGRLIPSAKVQTNSRGETLLFIRGAGERQVTLFFDDVPLNIPWDNRIDLSLIPAEAVGEINVTKGIPSVIYGPNAISGVVNIKPDFTNKPGKLGKLRGQFGNNNTSSFSGMYLNAGGEFSYLITSSYRETDGFTLPGEFVSATGSASGIRLNSQSRSFNLYSKTNYIFSSKGSIGLSASFINAEKGVPPETDVANPRYWKYPLWRRIGVNLNGDYFVSELSSSKINFIVAATGTESRIDQYSDVSFSQISDVEEGRDFTINGRFLYSGLAFESSLIKAAINAYSTIHKEKIMSDNFVEQRYVQNVLSLGAEYEYFINNLAIVAGFSYNLSETPETGDKPSREKLEDYSLNAGLVYSFSNNNTLHFSIGRKTRFPTLRETFSGALGRFVPNPDLKAEVAYSGEAGLTTLFPGGRLEINTFLSFLKDGIIRISLPRGQFQRVNKDVIRTFGSELVVNYRIERLFTYFHFTYLSAAAKNIEGQFKDTLEYKPKFISSLQLQYILEEGIEAMAEFSYTGEEFGLKEGSEYFRLLPDYFLINLRLGYNFRISESIKLELFGRINNLFDKLYYSQWSIPEAGREFRGGVSFEF
jgi:iron complex outermembrane receptor protein